MNYATPHSFWHLVRHQRSTPGAPLIENYLNNGNTCARGLGQTCGGASGQEVVADLGGCRRTGHGVHGVGRRKLRGRTSTAVGTRRRGVGESRIRAGPLPRRRPGPTDPGRHSLGRDHAGRRRSPRGTTGSTAHAGLGTPRREPATGSSVDLGRHKSGNLGGAHQREPVGPGPQRRCQGVARGGTRGTAGGPGRPCHRRTGLRRRHRQCIHQRKHHPAGGDGIGGSAAAHPHLPLVGAMAAAIAGDRLRRSGRRPQSGPRSPP